MIHTMVKCTLDVYQFMVPVMMTTLLKRQDTTKVNMHQLKQEWNEVPLSPDFVINIAVSPLLTSKDSIVQRCRDNNIYYLDSATNEQGGTSHYFHAKTVNDYNVLLELSSTGIAMASGTVKSKVPALIQLFQQAVMFVLSYA